MKRSHISSDETDDGLPVKRIRGGGGETVDGILPDNDDFLDEIDELREEEDVDEPPVDAVFSDISESMRKRWLRPKTDVKDNSDDFSFQCFDMDVFGGSALEKNPNESKSRVLGATSGQVPVIRAYGVNDSGNSVVTFIHGFTPYGFFALPPGAKFENTEANLGKIRQFINTRLEGVSRQRHTEYCRAVAYVDSFKSIMGYNTRHTRFLRITVAMPTLIPPLRTIMEEGINLPTVQTDGDNSYQPFEANIPFVLRYMIDKDIGGAGWLTLPKKTYQIRDSSVKTTHCQVRQGREKKIPKVVQMKDR